MTEIRTPDLFETVALNGDGLDKAPHPEVPYYLHAVEGNFLYRNTQIGTVLLRETKQPPTLGRIGYANGVFTWQGEKVPASIISQAHDFFKRIYQKHHAEAEVLITMHNETKQFRLFVPYQRVSHTGVKSVYEPTHVHKDYTVVGTLHSHCDFTAFHSSTDSGDASDMDGVHFTIGYVDKEVPQIVAMVAMAGKEFHYQDPKEIAEVEYGTATAPPWWDQYVYPASSPSDKPKSLKSITQAHWDEFRGLVQAKPKHTTQLLGPGVNRPNGWVSPYNQHKTVPKPIIRSVGSRSRDASNDWDNDGFDWRKYVYGGYKRPDDMLVEYDLFSKETGIPDLDAITKALDVAENSGVFTDEDYKAIKASDMDEIEFWRTFFTERMQDVAEVLDLLGMETEFTIETRKETTK